MHYNTQCGRTLTEALANCGNVSTALAVLGVMIEEGHENHDYDPILDGIFFIFPSFKNLLLIKTFSSYSSSTSHKKL